MAFNSITIKLLLETIVTCNMSKYSFSHPNFFNVNSVLFIDLQSLGPSSVSSQGETLKHLVLSKNKLSAVPTQAIRHLRNLEHLNLNENQIITLENEAFTGLNKVLCFSVDEGLYIDWS